jgi:hypothetical protein
MKHHHCDRCEEIIKGPPNVITIGPPYSFYIKRVELCRPCREELVRWCAQREATDAQH